MRNNILIIILLIVFVIYFYKRDKYFEQFTLIGDHLPTVKTMTSSTSTITHDKWRELTINNKRPLTFNQNWNKVWKAPVKSNKSTVVQDIPHLDGNFTPSKHTLVNMFTGKQIKVVLQKMINTPKNYETLKFNSIIVDPTKIERMNKNSWKDRLHLYNPDSSNNIYPTTKYPIPVINSILKEYLTIFNNKIKKEYSQFINKFGYSPFQIYKYKLIDIEEAELKITKNKINRYKIIVTILRDVNASRAFTLYLQYLVDNKGIITMQNYDLIGIYYTDQILMVKGFDENYSQDDLLKVYKPILPQNDQNNLKKNLNRFDITNQYSCFNDNPNDPMNTIITETDKQNCENKYDFFGREKPQGYWDKPCKSDNECPYKNSNKNYPNSFGKCKNGYCELPIGLKPLGYHYYFKTENSKPLCYNCKSKSWKPTTTLDNCCDKQKDKKIYPFLDGPDYAFKNDIFDRVNAYYKKNKCYTKHNYKNIFTDEIESSEVICPKKSFSLDQ